MSIFAAPLTPFTLEKHPNADTLSIAQVKGWQCVVRTSDFENETLGVYIPLEAIADIDHPLLSFLKGKRVETCKLRGAISQGVLLPFHQVKDYMKNTLGMSDLSIEKVSVEGKDFAGILRVKRWVDTSTKLAMGGNAETPHPAFHKYTDIENIKNFTDVIALGEQVHISEKLHGTSARFGLAEDKFMIGSRNLQLKLEADTKTLWHHSFEAEKIKDKLLALLPKSQTKTVAIYGEIVGPRIQDLKYGVTEPTFFAYDISIDGKFVSPVEFHLLCGELQLRHVPVLKMGALEQSDFELRRGSSTLDSSHVREGIVIKPLNPRFHMDLGRVILKVISEDYLMRKGAKDVGDV